MNTGGEKLLVYSFILSSYIWIFVTIGAGVVAVHFV